MNRFFLVTIIFIVFLGCIQNEFVEVPELPAVPFVWAYYIENSKTTYAQAIAYDDIYGDFSTLSYYEDLLLDNSYNIHLEKNSTLLAEYEHLIYIDTIIRIFQDAGSEPDTFISYDRSVIYNYQGVTMPTLPDKAGDIFELKIQHPEFSEMYAQQKMPTNVPIEKLEILKVEPAYELHIQAHLQITINDPADIPNYYEITAAVLPRDNTGEITTEDINLRPANIWADDPEIIDYESIVNRSSIYLSDKSFDGQEKQINFKVGPFFGSELPEDFYIIWRCVSPEWYRFFEARRASFENPFLRDNNNLTQPYSLPFNIEGGGFGLFGVGTEEIYKVE